MTDYHEAMQIAIDVLREEAARNSDLASYPRYRDRVIECRQVASDLDRLLSAMPTAKELRLALGCLGDRPLFYEDRKAADKVERFLRILGGLDSD